MKGKHSNKVMSSFILWFNHILLDKAQAYQNYGSLFYPTNQVYNGLQAYACPFNQLVSDSSVAGAQIPTGIYVNGNFVTPGISGFHGIDYERGRVYFTGLLPVGTRISGDISYKEVNVTLSNSPEEQLLFETKYTARPKQGQIPTGLWTNQMSYPLIIIKKFGGKNEPLAFGGQDNTFTQISAIILSDSQFTLDAIASTFEDSTRTVVPYLDTGDYPYNSYGELKSTYNFSALASGKDFLFVDQANYVPFRQTFYSQLRQINPEVYFGVIDFVIFKNRFPRQE